MLDQYLANGWRGLMMGRPKMDREDLIRQATVLSCSDEKGRKRSVRLRLHKTSSNACTVVPQEQIAVLRLGKPSNNW